MDGTITVPADDAAATPDLQSLLRGAGEGREYVITRGGRPVARLVAEPPSPRRSLAPDQERGLAELREADWTGLPKEPFTFHRDDAYEERLDRQYKE